MENRKADPDSPSTKDLEEMMKEYDNTKNLLDINDPSITCAITAEQIFSVIDDLYKLDIYGQKIRESQEKQKRARNVELKANVVLKRSPKGLKNRFSNWVKKHWYK